MFQFQKSFLLIHRLIYKKQIAILNDYNFKLSKDVLFSNSTNFQFIKTYT